MYKIDKLRFFLGVNIIVAQETQDGNLLHQRNLWLLKEINSPIPEDSIMDYVRLHPSHLEEDVDLQIWECVNFLNPKFHLSYLYGKVIADNEPSVIRLALDLVSDGWQVTSSKDKDPASTLGCLDSLTQKIELFLKKENDTR